MNDNANNNQNDKNRDPISEVVRSFSPHCYDTPPTTEHHHQHENENDVASEDEPHTTTSSIRSPSSSAHIMRFPSTTAIVETDDNKFIKASDDPHHQRDAQEEEQISDDEDDILNEPHHTVESNSSSVVVDDENDNNINSKISILSLISWEEFTHASSKMQSHFIGSATNQFGSFVGQSILMMSVGRHLTVPEIASVGVGLSINSLFGVAISVGASSGCETLISQAFGRGDIHAVAKWTQLGVLVCLALCIPISILFLFSAPLITFAFGAQYVDGATLFLRWAIPFLFLQSGAACLIKGFQASQQAHIPAKARLISAATMIFGAFVFVPYFKISGAALCMGFGSLTQLVAMHIIAHREVADSSNTVGDNNTSKDTGIVDDDDDDDDQGDDEQQEETDGKEKKSQVVLSKTKQKAAALILKLDWNVFDLLKRSFFANNKATSISQQQNNTNTLVDDEEELADTTSDESSPSSPEGEQQQQSDDDEKLKFSYTLHDVWEFIQVAAPGSVSTILEFSCFEAMTLISSHIGEVVIAAFQLYLAMSLLFVSLAFALTITTSSFVGKSLGEGDAKSAVLYGKVCVIHAAFLGILTGAFLILLDEHFFSLYTTNETLIDQLKKVVFIYAVLRTADNVQIVLQGIARGAGQQKIVPFFVAFALGGIAIPCAYVLGVVFDFKLGGLLMSLCIGLTMLAPMLLWKISQFDWIQLARDASSEKKA